jgi:hypothetical protein
MAIVLRDVPQSGLCQMVAFTTNSFSLSLSPAQARGGMCAVDIGILKKFNQMSFLHLQLITILNREASGI